MRQTMLSWGAFAMSIVLLSGCAPSPKEPLETLPEWVSNPPKSSRYLYGVGSYERIDNLALAFAQAEQNGNGQIAQQLKTQVSQTSTSQVNVSNSGQGEQVIRNDSLYTKVKTAPIELEQTSNQERYTGTQYVYALQVLDRSRALSRLRLQIDELESSIREQAAELSPAIVEADWPIYMALIPDFAQRANLVEKYQLYSQNGASYAGDDRVKSIESQLSKALRQFRFYLPSTPQRNELEAAFTEAGFLTSKAPATFSVSTDTQLRNEIQKTRHYAFIEGTLSLTARDGTMIGSWQVSGRGIGLNDISAEQKARQSWADKAVEALLTHLSTQR